MRGGSSEYGTAEAHHYQWQDALRFVSPTQFAKLANASDVACDIVQVSLDHRKHVVPDHRHCAERSTTVGWRGAHHPGHPWADAVGRARSQIESGKRILGAV